MPTDREGQRWSCEPCIRGHRSGRCQHFDRWMVRVKGPGRPLRECPHRSPCSCVSERVMMVKIPRSSDSGECHCRRMTKEELGRQVNQPDQRPQRQWRRSGQSRITPYPSVQPTPSLPTSADAQFASCCEGLMNIDMSARASGRAITRDLRAEPSHSIPMEHAMQPQQQPMDPCSRIPTPPTGAIQGYHHEQSILLTQSQSPATVQGGGSPQQFIPPSNGFFNPNSHSVRQNGTHSQSSAAGQGGDTSQQFNPASNGFSYPNSHSVQLNGTQSHSPAAVQGGGSPQQFIPASNGFFNPDSHSVQPNGTPFQPHGPIYTQYQTDLNDQNGHSSVATLTPSPNSLIQHGMDLTYPAAINQQTQSKQMNPFYSPTRNPMYTPAAAPSVNFDARMAPQHCLCGPNCNCLYCTSHPFNRATSERVQDLTDILASDNYWDEYPSDPNLSQPQYETGDALTNGTHVEPAMDPTDVDSFTSSPHGPIIIPKRTFDDEDDNDQSNNFASPQMRNQDYVTLQYRFKCKCTNTTGTCLCLNGCACPGCCTHRGHVEALDLSELPML